jgi:hypothetical protein
VSADFPKFVSRVDSDDRSDDADREQILVRKLYNFLETVLKMTYHISINMHFRTDNIAFSTGQDSPEYPDGQVCVHLYKSIRIRMIVLQAKGQWT